MSKFVRLPTGHIISKEHILCVEVHTMDMNWFEVVVPNSDNFECHYGSDRGGMDDALDFLLKDLNE